MSGKPTPILFLSSAAYGLLLRACPGSYRREFGALMAQAFGDLARDAYAQRGAWGVAALWLRILPDECTTALAEYIVALRERRTVVGAEFAAVGTQGISVGVGGSAMRKATVVLAVVVVAAIGILASPLLLGYRPAVTAAPGVVLYVATQPGWLDGVRKAQADLADETPATYALLGWSAGGVLYYWETDTATQATRTWAYTPGKGARPQRVAEPAGIVSTAVSPREALLDLVRAPVWPPSAEPSTRPLHIPEDGLASPDGRWAAVVAKHIYGPEDVIVIALE